MIYIDLPTMALDLAEIPLDSMKLVTVDSIPTVKNDSAAAPNDSTAVTNDSITAPTDSSRMATLDLVPVVTGTDPCSPLTDLIVPTTERAKVAIDTTLVCLTSDV